MRWIYLSPHLDDAAYSCGGLIWQQAQAGEQVEIWTICAGAPPPGNLSDYAQELHARWEVTAEEVLAVRKQEDRDARSVLGVSGRYFDIPDTIYRKHYKTGEPMYTSDEDIFGGVDLGDEPTLQRVMLDLAQNVPVDARLVSPLTVGNHIDHQLVRLAASGLEREVWYYPEFPYTMQSAAAIPSLVPEGYRPEKFGVSPEGMAVWQESIRQFRSQFSTFWKTEADLVRELTQHAAAFGGVTLWRP
ncbi:PIG-L family deacetylase [bacterium]|nr:PIG-L family deacetylase [bacterium]